MPEQTRSKNSSFYNTTQYYLSSTAAEQNTAVLTTALHGTGQYICKELNVNVCNYKVSFIGHYSQGEGSTLLLNKIIKAVCGKNKKGSKIDAEVNRTSSPGTF